MPSPKTSLNGNKTEMERTLQQQKWNAAAITRRRIRRDEDPEYRAQHAAQSREYFRQKYGVDPSTFRDCRKNIDKLDQFGTERTISQEPLLTFTVAEIAAVFGDYKPVIMNRWIKKGQIPPPALETDDGSTVYLDAEIEAIIPILGEQQSQSKYFRADHHDVIAAIADAVDTVRQELGIS